MIVNKCISVLLCLQVIEELTRRLQNSDDARENHRHEMQLLRGMLVILGRMNYF